MSASLVVRGTDQFEGPDWERAFATAIGAEWKPSNIGLDDIVLDGMCWGAKTVKGLRPFRQRSVRLISGRNSPDYSYGTTNVHTIPEQTLGDQILAIYNERVSAVRQRFAHARTVVLIKGPGLVENSLFETETLRFEPERFVWRWNVRGNLEGFDEQQVKRFTWQPHGSQFTIVEAIPEERVRFRVNLPIEIRGIQPGKLLELIGFRDDWIEVL